MANSLKAKKTLINEKARLMKYVPIDVQREVASNTRNIETQRDLLINSVSSAHPDLARIFNDNYYDELDEIIEFLEKKYPSETKQSMDAKLGIRKSGKKVNNVEARPVVVKSKGKTYTRARNKRFENKGFVIKFIKMKSDDGVKTKKIVDEYNSFAKANGLTQRSYSSIASLKSRNKIKTKRKK